MEVRPGYKQTEVGVFPEDWKIAQLGGIAEVEGGYAFSSKAFLASGTYQVVKMSNLYGGTLDLERSASFLNELTEQERHYLLRPNHIILTLTGTTGKRDYGYSYMVTREQNLLLNQRVGRVVVSDNSCAGFVSLQLRSPCFLNQFFELSKGGTGNQTNVGTKDVAAMRIPVPALPEQRAIATALSDVDGLLSGLDRLIAKKRDLKQAAMQQLLTGQTRLPGFHEEWQVKRLGDIADILKGSALSKTLTTSSGVRRCILYGELFTTYGRVISDVFGRTNSSEGCPSIYGDVLMPASTTTTGIDLATASALLLDEVALGGDIIIIRQKGSAYDSVFLANYLTQARRREIAELTQGITIHHLYGKDLKTVSLQIPDLPEQTAIAKVLTEMDAELAALEQRREKTHALKQAMMQELLTGKTRLISTREAHA